MEKTCERFWAGKRWKGDMGVKSNVIRGGSICSDIYEPRA